MNKILKFILLGIPIFLFVALPIFAASSTFLPKAQKWIDNNCSKRSISNQDSLLCFLFEKSKETDIRLNTTEQNIININNTIATFSGVIKPPPSFRTPPDFVLTWGQLGTSRSEFNSPSYISSTSAPEVYITDSGNNRIQVFDSNGGFLREWGTTGSGDGQFNNPQGLVFDGSSCCRVYVADSGNNRVQGFGYQGNYFVKFGSLGTGDGQFTNLHDITTDFAGFIYTLEDNRIQVFDNAGHFQRSYSFGGQSFKIDKTGLIYVANLNDKRIKIYDINGNFMRQTQPVFVNGPYGVAVDSNGNIYGTDYGSPGNDESTIRKFNNNGGLLVTFGGIGDTTGKFNKPTGLTIDYFGKLFIVDKDNNRIQKFSY